MMDVTLGGKLKSLRKQQGLTLKRLSELSGVSISHISALERGERTHPSYDRVARLAMALGVLPGYFYQDNAIVVKNGEQEEGEVVFKNLPPDIQAFIAKETSGPYILLAKRLSEAGLDSARLMESIADFLRNYPSSSQ